MAIQLHSPLRRIDASHSLTFLDNNPLAMNCPRCHSPTQEMRRTLGFDSRRGERDLIVEYYCTGCNRRWEHWEGTCKIEELT